MKTKKLLAGAMALTLTATCFSPMVAKADTIDSGAVYVDKSIYKVTLPTTASQKFYLDPEGLASGAISGDTWSAGTEGSVVTDTTGMTAKNSSSMPVALETKIKLVSSEETEGIPDCAIGTASADTITATVPTIFMTATYTDDAASSGTAATLDSNLATGGVATLSSTEQTIDTILPAATYSFKLKDGATAGSKDSSDYQYVMTADTESGVNIKLAGNCAKAADWSDFVGDSATKSIKLDVVFKFYQTKDKADGDTTQVKDGDKAVATDTAPSITATNNTITMTSGSSLTIPFNLGTGDLAAENVTSVLWVDQNAEFLGSADGNVTISGNNIVVSQATIAYFMTLSENQKLKITFDDAANTSATITLAKPTE